MAISQLQREAFMVSQSFINQTNGIVRQEALYKGDQITGTDEASQAQRQQLKQVALDPAAFGFVPNIVADAAWSVTYDAWAGDPAGAESAIQGTVQKFWLLLVG